MRVSRAVIGYGELTHPRLADAISPNVLATGELVRAITRSSGHGSDRRCLVPAGRFQHDQGQNHPVGR